MHLPIESIFQASAPAKGKKNAKRLAWSAIVLFATN